MITLGNDKDKFGFYSVGNYKTYSKLEAIELHQRTNIHPHWNFNEEFFSMYDWTREPVQTLDQLYAKRARQIRDTYDYVVLLCSGGADSMNVLDTFVKNNIPFDEILTYNYQAADSNPDSFFNAELTKVMWPKIQQLKDQGICFRHKNVDLSVIAAEVLTSKKFALDRGYLATRFFSTAHICKSYIRERDPDYQRLLEQDQKVVFVWGSEKPRLYQEQGRYCLKFLDAIDNAVSPLVQINNRENEYDELFYWAPEAADIICKQGHVLKNFFTQYHGRGHDNYYSDSIMKIPSVAEIFDNKKTSDGLNFRDIINSLIYTNWDINTFSVGKSGGLASSLDTVWNKDTIFYKHIDLLIQHISGISSYWLADPNNIKKGIKLCISPAYFLE
jgi:hypothetical protein